MAGLVDQQCLACACSDHPVCDGSGVRLVRGPDGQVVDVLVCPRWPAAWDEPIAYFEALDHYGIDVIPPEVVPERIWPAVQAEIARTQQQPGAATSRAGQEPPGWQAIAAKRGRSHRALGLLMLLSLSAVVVLIIIVALVVTAW